MQHSESETPLSKQSNPDIDRIVTQTLYEGLRVKHELLYGVVKDRNTGKAHHDYVSFKTLRKTKASPWKLDPKASFTLSEDKNQELSRALSFLNETRASTAINSHSDWSHKDLVQALNQLDHADRLEIIIRLLHDLKQSPDSKQIMSLMEHLEANDLRLGQGLFQIAAWRQSLREFHHLLKQVASATTLKVFFEQHLWLLGLPTCPLVNLTELFQNLATPIQGEFILLEPSKNEFILLGFGDCLSDTNLLDFDPVYQCWFPCSELTILQGQLNMCLGQLNPLLKKQAQLSDIQIQSHLFIGQSATDQLANQALQDYQQHLKELKIRTYSQVNQQALQLLSYLQQRHK